MFDKLSKSKSSAESGSFDIFMDMFGGDRLFNNLTHAERSIAGGVEIPGRSMQGSSSGPPGLNLLQLDKLELPAFVFQLQ